MKVSRIIEDISFKRFITELIYYTKRHSDLQLDYLNCGDDEDAEDAFMFFAKVSYEEKEN